ncbi:hypothetical protein B0T21DRAFT_353553 [Apiosordaria backusii]|uniref:Uncharacterized protein n=1 Tax=Apiosordaria backusii TaxID=314023 RepID=A0AA39ZRR3_9PEZI|nr:hypothetical protein B0T21DRAFT_353553 [Apiosordaria backusii]
MPFYSIIIIKRRLSIIKSLLNKEVIYIKKVLYRKRFKYFLLITKNRLSLYTNNILKKLGFFKEKGWILLSFNLFIRPVIIYISINNKTFKGNVINNNNNSGFKVKDGFNIFKGFYLLIIITFTLYFKIIYK